MTPRWFVQLAVIVSGAAVLAVEIIGTRLLGPFYGTSIYLWSAMIAVTLGSLSLGYWLGGRWADQGPRLGRLCALIGGAGLWTALVPWLRHPILAATESLGLRAAVLAASLVLFVPPLALLGMVSPYAVRLASTSIAIVGRTAGRLYSLSTLAGIAAALSTGFVLIPAAGPERLAFLVGIALIVTALAGAAAAAKKRSIVLAALVAIAASLAAAIGAAPGDRANPSAGLVAVEHTPYGEIRVVTKDDLRLMLIDGMVHTEVDTLSFGSPSDYVAVLDLAGGFFREPGRMLLVGLGGGAIAGRYARGGWNVDAVEIDPGVTRAALEYFRLDPSIVRVFEMDGREFLMAHDAEYDLIIVDAFGSSSIPFHLVTREAFARFRARLAPGGVIALNVIAVGWDDVLVRSLAATLGSEFANVVVLPMAEPPDQLGNLVILASSRALDLLEEPPVPMDRFSLEYHRAHAWDNRFSVDPTGVRVITDDLNPADLWAEHINLEIRKGLREYFGESGMGW